jgi:hypothetical protein
MSGAKRASWPSQAKLGSPLSSTPSKTRPRTGVVALIRPPLFDGAGSGTSAEPVGEDPEGSECQHDAG